MSSERFDLDSVDRLLTTTRSVRRRLDLSRPLDADLVDECLTLALQAPNGSGAQQWRFVVVLDPDQRRLVGELYARSSAGYLAELRAEYPDLDETAPGFLSSKFLWDHLGDVPALVVPCYRPDAWERTSDRQAYVAASAYGTILPAMWSFQLACRSRGLGTCFVTSLLKYDDELRALLGIPSDVVIGGVVAVAHTSGDFSVARRLPLDQVRSFDRW